MAGRIVTREFLLECWPDWAWVGRDRKWGTEAQWLVSESAIVLVDASCGDMGFPGGGHKGRNCRLEDLIFYRGHEVMMVERERRSAEGKRVYAGVGMKVAVQERLARLLDGLGVWGDSEHGIGYGLAGRNRSGLVTVVAGLDEEVCA